MPCIIIQRKTEQSQFEYCELKHRRRRMLHFIAYVFSSRFTRKSARPAASSLSLSLAHVHTQPNLVVTPFFLQCVDGWALHYYAFVPFLACYPVILLFLLHCDAFSSVISKHWKEICCSDQNHASSLKNLGEEKYIYIYKKHSLSIKTLGIAFQDFSQPEECVHVCVL